MASLAKPAEKNEPSDVPEQDSRSDYRVLKILGEGCFGQVAKCIHRQTKETVALKVLKKAKEGFIQRELGMLSAIGHLDPDAFNLIRFIEFFEHNGRQCMAFEMLDISVEELMKRRGARSFSLSEVRPMARQLLVALVGLRRVGVMHTDIKPDNIMLVDHEKRPFKVKLIDFGVARRRGQVRAGQAMQPGSYRAPEVTLGLPLWEAVDVWSLGCCLALWYLGSSPFKSYSPYDNLRKIVHFLGVPKDELLTRALYTKKYFLKDGSRWRLKTVLEFKAATGDAPELSRTRLTIASNLRDLIRNFRKYQPAPESSDRSAFHDLLEKMFEVDAEKRITPTEALLHPFITMDHLPRRKSYTEEAQGLMSGAETQFEPLQRKALEESLDEKQEKATSEGENRPKIDNKASDTEQKALFYLRKAGCKNMERNLYQSGNEKDGNESENMTESNGETSESSSEQRGSSEEDEETISSSSSEKDGGERASGKAANPSAHEEERQSEDGKPDSVEEKQRRPSEVGVFPAPPQTPSSPVEQVPSNRKVPAEDSVESSALFGNDTGAERSPRSALSRLRGAVSRIFNSGNVAPKPNRASLVQAISKRLQKTV